MPCFSCFYYFAIKSDQKEVGAEICSWMMRMVNVGKGWRNTSEVMVASFGMWGAAWVRGKNEGKRRGRLPDTYVNESECTDLKIGQEFGSRKNSYWQEHRRRFYPVRKKFPWWGKGEKHVNTESRKVMGRIQMESQQDDDETKTKNESKRVTHKYICVWRADRNSSVKWNEMGLETNNSNGLQIGQSEKHVNGERRLLWISANLSVRWHRGVTREGWHQGDTTTPNWWHHDTWPRHRVSRWGGRKEWKRKYTFSPSTL